MTESNTLIAIPADIDFKDAATRAGQLTALAAQEALESNALDRLWRQCKRAAVVLKAAASAGLPKIATAEEFGKALGVETANVLYKGDDQADLRKKAAETPANKPGGLKLGGNAVVMRADSWNLAVTLTEEGVEPTADLVALTFRFVSTGVNQAAVKAAVEGGTIFKVKDKEGKETDVKVAPIDMDNPVAGMQAVINVLDEAKNKTVNTRSPQVDATDKFIATDAKNVMRHLNSLKPSEFSAEDRKTLFDWCNNTAAALKKQATSK